MNAQATLDLSILYEVECDDCGHVQREYLVPNEWSWVECKNCLAGFHINPTQGESWLINTGDE